MPHTHLRELSPKLLTRTQATEAPQYSKCSLTEAICMKTTSISRGKWNEENVAGELKGERCLQRKRFEADITSAKFLEEFLPHLEGLPNKDLLDNQGHATWRLACMENRV